MTNTRFAILAVITLGCATGEQTEPDVDPFLYETGAGTANNTAGSAMATSGSGGSGFAGTGEVTAGTFAAPGPFGNAGTFGTAGGNAAGASTAGASAGSPAGGTGGAGGNGNGTAGKSSGGTAGTGTSGTGGTGVVVTAYCDTHAKSPLPYTVNEGFQPSGWQGDLTAINGAAIAPDGCAARAAGAVGNCSAWRYAPNAVTPAWAGVSWSKMWDANYLHDPVCLATGATKVTFQARGAVGGEQVIFSAAGGAELPFTLTNAWKAYSVSLVGIEYNTFAIGVTSGFFWKVAPPTPNGAPVVFFIDDIHIEK